MTRPPGSARAALDAAPAAAGWLLAVFALYAAALDLGSAAGLVGTIVSAPGLGLLLGAAALLLAGAAGAVASAGPLASRAPRALCLAGAALALGAFPASLAGRSARSIEVGEGQEIGPAELPGAGPMRFGEVRLAPRGPHLLSKTVEIEAQAADGTPVRIGLFPATRLGPWRLSVVSFGYAPGVSWRRADGTPVAGGFVKLGTFPRTEEESRLVTWTPEANVMMGAGTFPPKLEDLLTPPGGADHLFLRLDEATIAGQRRNLRDPDAWRWLTDGRLEDAVFFAQVFRGREKVFEGAIRAGERARFEGGSVALEPDVRLWVELLATRDPWLAWALAGAALLAAGLLARAAVALGARARRARRPT